MPFFVRKLQTPKPKPQGIISFHWPEISRAGVARLFRELMSSQDPTIPVIALTAYGSIQDRDRALEAGFDRHLAKPIDPAELVRIIVKTRADKLNLVG